MSYHNGLTTHTDTQSHTCIFFSYSLSLSLSLSVSLSQAFQLVADYQTPGASLAPGSIDGSYRCL
jgi:hypothetical protein